MCGARFVNDPSAERLASFKPYQLRIAASVGLSVPRTLITNDAAAADKFIQTLVREGRRCVFKTLTPGKYHFGETRVIASVAQFKQELSFAPTIFQECIERGEDIRITIFGERSYCARVSAPIDNTAVDWRLSPLATYEPYTINKELLALLKTLLAKLGLLTGSFDLRISPEQVPYFFEVNPSGAFLYLERFGFPTISKDFGAFLRET